LLKTACFYKICGHKKYHPTPVKVSWSLPWTCLTFPLYPRSGRSRDHMVVGFTTNDVSSNPVYGEVYLIKHYVIQFVSDYRQVGGFLRVPFHQSN